MIAALGGRLGAAARRLVARRRRQQQHVAVARRPASTTTPRCPGACAGAAAAARRATAPRRPASRGSCRRRSRTGRRRPRRRARSSRPPSTRRRRHGKPHAAFQCGRAHRAIEARHAADFGAALHAGVAANRHETAIGPPGSPRARPTLTSAFTVSTPCACCVSPIDHTKTAFGRAISRSANSLDALARHAAVVARCGPSRPSAARAQASLEAGRASRDERLVDAAALDQRQQHAEQEREVAAGVHLEPVVGQRRAEERALGDRRNPVALEPRLAVRVHDGDLRAVASWRGAGTSSSPAGCWRRWSRTGRSGRRPASRRSCRWRRAWPSVAFIATVDAA